LFCVGAFRFILSVVHYFLPLVLGHIVMTELILAMSFAIGFSFICSLLEAVLYSLPMSQVENLAQSGSISGKLLKKFRQDVDAPLAAILSLNTIAHTVGAAMAGAAAADVLGAEALGYFSVVFTLAVLVFSEIIPKTAGVVYAKELALWIARPLQWLIWGLAPLVWLCQFVTRVISSGRVEHQVSGEEIKAMARLGLQSGNVGQDESGIIQNVLTLKDKFVKDVMTPRMVVFSLSAYLSISDIQKTVGIPTFSRIPITDESPEDVVGIVLRRDILLAISEGRLQVDLMQLMRPVDFVLDTLPLDRVLRLFLEKKEHIFMVIDEFGGLSGVIALEDVLEEILGHEIVDELDEAVDLRALARSRRQQARGFGPSADEQ
jgi:CBS domain containing-hemolysin-like protein